MLAAKGGLEAVRVGLTFSHGEEEEEEEEEDEPP